MMWLSVAIGGALGAMARYGLTSYLLPIDVKSFPIGTLTANIVGSALAALFYFLILEKQWLTIEWRPFIMVGFLGALTTYSTFALESILLWQQGQLYYALLYIATSLIGCCLAVVSTFFLARQLLA